MATTTAVSLTTPTGLSYQQPTGLFINNEFVAGSGEGTIDVINPATEQKICAVSEARENDVDKAVAVARKALNGQWKLTTPTERSQYLYKLVTLMEESLEKLAAVESMDNGKAINGARGDIEGAIGCLRYYAGWADKIEGRVIDTSPTNFNYTRREPIGVCGQIIPWNFPLMMWAWKIGPAIACGNTVVIKTAEVTPLSALVAAELVVQAGFPPGVINIITGYGNIAGSALSRHMGVDKVAFTGSTAVGRQILKDAASSNLKKVTLELGGKSPNIVFNDANIDQAVPWIHNGIFSNMGQNCCAGSRIYVQSGIYDTFVQRLKESVQQRVIGSPEDEKTAHGAQVSKTQLDRILGYVDSGKKAGAQVEIGGHRVDRPGYFMEPTIFSGVSSDMDIVREEIFGPVGVIAKFDTTDEIVEAANDTAYGLASGIHTENLKTAIEVSNKIKAGTVWVNQYNGVHWQLPFGGFKQSGIGRELGEEALFNYTQTKTVSVNLGTPVV
ncbi:aldehyde dehydrogenase family protein [Aspergillus ruber CBS 135680]|uniref:Aldehyde dehydrogenase n=1 Tax=Aspergillus ruber (strain CBS 135680) TaxID=1388766 RepID=A0A017SQR2_ASPRC|nr:aldehyde dehydrogenase, allergen Cla h 10 [Aspergillus ruber CBS 135680]EYE99328.1 aldehyde dehydrogenase, allergen Cla h 10 [Aspergillus ruber CBS 135680]